MSTGIRAELSFGAAQSCDVARATGEAGVETKSISRSIAPTTGQVTEEFAIEDDGKIDDPEIDEVFSYGSRTVYRFSRDQDEACPCETVEGFGSPVMDIHTDDGTLHLAVHVEDMDELQDIVTDVRSRYPDVSVDRLVRSQPEGDSADLVLVNRGELTPRQEEVLQTAHEMGYFAHPKGANAGQVADRLGISTSTFTEHLSAAQRKLLSAILE